jgi:hypothetical protein
MIHRRFLPVTALVAIATAVGCAAQRVARAVPAPRIIPHSQWQSQPPVGYAADATRRNKAAGDSLAFHDLTVTVLGTSADSSRGKPVNVARLRLAQGTEHEDRMAPAGSAFNWRGFHIAVVAVYGPGELGGGLVALEAATIASLPALVAASESAGGANMRLRIPHRITHVTLHHTGDAQPLRPEDDPAAKLRGLQSWGASDRNWWDVPYHYLLDLQGRIYEGRDWHYMGETNTAYDPGGHFLISIIGNFDKQEATPAQLASIADMMAWAIQEFDLPLDRIGGHYNYATTDCPGKNLRKYLEDGTLRRMVSERLASK